MLNFWYLKFAGYILYTSTRFNSLYENKLAITDINFRVWANYVNEDSYAFNLPPQNPVKPTGLPKSTRQNIVYVTAYVMGGLVGLSFVIFVVAKLKKRFFPKKKKSDKFISASDVPKYDKLHN